MQTIHTVLTIRLPLRVPVVVNIDTLERIGGANARCMLAHVHLPARPSF